MQVLNHTLERYVCTDKPNITSASEILETHPQKSSDDTINDHVVIRYGKRDCIRWVTRIARYATNGYNILTYKILTLSNMHTLVRIGGKVDFQGILIFAWNS